MNYGATVTYDNGAEAITFCRDGDFWLTAAPDLSSVQVDISEAQTAGQAGSAITGQQVLPKTITFTGCILRDIPQNREKLLRVVAPGKSASVIYRHGGKSYALEGAPTRTPQVSAGVAVQDFQFTFRVPYPYWRDTQMMEALVAGLEPRFRFPFSTGGRWYLSRFSDAYYRVVANEGNVPVAFEVTFEALGHVENPVLLHMGRGTALRVRRVLAPGQKLVVSTRYGQRGAVLVDGAGKRENAFASLAVDSDLTMALDAGDNLLYFTADAGRELARVVVRAPRTVVSGV